MESWVVFSPHVLPPYFKRAAATKALIPWPYLKGISTGDFSGALQKFVDELRPQKKRLCTEVQSRVNDSGNDLLSHLSALSSALITLTVEFGMGSGVCHQVWSPEIPQAVLSNDLRYILAYAECITVPSLIFTLSLLSHE